MLSIQDDGHCDSPTHLQPLEGFLLLGNYDMQTRLKTQTGYKRTSTVLPLEAPK
jgi:hypothetical protein